MPDGIKPVATATTIPVIEIGTPASAGPALARELGVAVARCPLCDGHPDAVVGVKDGLRVLRCDTCTLQFSEHVPSLQEIRSLYGEHYFHGAPNGYPDYARDELLHRERAREYLGDLHGSGAVGGRVLDVGCATGFFLDEARRAGWQAVGWEVSDWAADYARTRLGLEMVVGSFPEAPAHIGTFDLVTFFNAFEQLPSARRAEEMLRSLVNRGGLVALETWDASAAIVRLLGMRWHKYRPRETPYYLNRTALQVLFAPEHWELLRFEPRTKWISIRHGLHALGLADRHPGHEMSPRKGLLDLRVPYRLGDLVWVVLRRRDG